MAERQQIWIMKFIAEDKKGIKEILKIMEAKTCVSISYIQKEISQADCLNKIREEKINDLEKKLWTRFHKMREEKS